MNLNFSDINQSIPMVAWSKNQESGLQTETFMLLLHKLGFHLATDVGKCFPRIPHFWSADHLYNLALKIGPLRKEELKMDLSLLETSSACQDPADLNPDESSASASSSSSKQMANKEAGKVFDDVINMASSPSNSSKICCTVTETDAAYTSAEATTSDYSTFAM